MIATTPFEKKLFALLLAYDRALGLGITYRVAGGWVRDRVMGAPSHDIDIAIDRSSGSAFALGFMKYLQGRSEKVSGYRVTAFNYEKSKHLETASLLYLGHSIDFVGLRTEEYASSRIPFVHAGTPREDANRRDITINALFYNINTMEIEDYTEKGLLDIEEKRIRTPLDPLKTFTDDPLRILRVLRFAARLFFSIDPAILSVLGEKSLHEKLTLAVSKERVGQEVRKILAYPGYDRALGTMAAHGILRAILPVVEVSLDEVARYTGALESAQKLEGHPAQSIKSAGLYAVRVFALLQNSVGRKRGKARLAEHVIAEYFKWTKRERKAVAAVEECVEKVGDILRAKMKMPKTDMLVRVSRVAGKCLEEALTVYDVLQGEKAPGEPVVDVVELYTDIVSSGYKDIYLQKHSIDCASVLKELGIEVSAVAPCLERYTQLSIIHKEASQERLFALLKREMSASPQ